MSTLDLQLKTIRVYGTLAKTLKRRTFKAVIRSPQDAINFLLSNFPELKSFIAPRAFQIIVNHKPITEHQLATNVDFIDDEIHIIPAISGAGGNNNALFAILAGTVLIAASFIFPLAAPILLPLGIGLVLTGVAALIAPVIPEDPEDADPAKSYNFSGVQNTSREGVAVPCVYGEIVTGSVTISLGIMEDEEKIEPEFVGGLGDPCPFNDPDLLADGSPPGYQLPGNPYKCDCPEQLPGLPSNIPPPPDDDGIYCDAVGSSSVFAEDEVYFWTFRLYMWGQYDDACACNPPSSCNSGTGLFGGFGETQNGVDEVGSLWTQESVIGQYVVIRTWKTRIKYICSGTGGTGNFLWKVYYYNNGTWNWSTNLEAYTTNDVGVANLVTNSTTTLTTGGFGFYSDNYPAYSPIGFKIIEKYPV